jgi:hypothetical protein
MRVAEGIMVYSVRVQRLRGRSLLLHQRLRVLGLRGKRKMLGFHLWRHLVHHRLAHA